MNILSFIFIVILAAITFAESDINQSDIDSSEIFAESVIDQSAIDSSEIQPTRRGTERITNGTIVQNLSQFPYQVGISSSLPSGKSSWCGGSLISNQWILTAAHCVKPATGSKIYLGVIDRTNKYKLTVTKSNYVVHNKYNSYSLINDIALIKLPAPVQLSSTIKAIPLDKDSALSKWVNKDAVVSGWGSTVRGGQVTRFLQYAEVKIISNRNCALAWGSVPSTQICQKVINNKGICNGDSGGPLTAIENGKRVLIGIASYGDCKVKPRGYTRVATYQKWICDNTGKTVC